MTSGDDQIEAVVDGRGAIGEAPPIVLVVEDDADTLEMYEALLSARGYWVARAANGVDAVESAQALRPDAIVIDVGLPGGMDGTELIRELQADGRLRGIPVLVVTGREPRHLPSFAGLRISGILVKPVAPDTLLAQVEQILGGSFEAGPGSTDYRAHSSS
jgi:chemosensory pili system protein ChpA (sensor histidine kinase/response regulator)